MFFTRKFPLFFQGEDMITEEKKEKIRELYLRDSNLSAISKQTGVSRPTIRKILRKAGLYRDPDQEEYRGNVCEWPTIKHQLNIVATDYRNKLEDRLRVLQKGKRHILIGVTGHTGLGKSYFSLHLACLIDPAFDVTGVIFNRFTLSKAVPSSLLRVLILDDAECIAASGDWRDDWIQEFQNVVFTSRHRKIGDIEKPLSLVFNMPHRETIAKKIREALHLIIEIVHRCTDHVHAVIHDPARNPGGGLGQKTTLGTVCYYLNEYDDDLIYHYEAASKDRSSVSVPDDGVLAGVEIVEFNRLQRKIVSKITVSRAKLKQYEEYQEAKEMVELLSDVLEQIKLISNKDEFNSFDDYFERERPAIRRILAACEFDSRKDSNLNKVQDEITELSTIRDRKPELDRRTTVTLLIDHYCGIIKDGDRDSFEGIDGKSYFFRAYQTSENIKMADSLLCFRINLLRTFEQILVEAESGDDLDKCEEFDNLCRNPGHIIKELKRKNEETRKREQERQQLKMRKKEAAHRQEEEKFAADLSATLESLWKGLSANHQRWKQEQAVNRRSQAPHQVTIKNHTYELRERPPNSREIPAPRPHRQSIMHHIKIENPTEFSICIRPGVACLQSSDGTVLDQIEAATTSSIPPQQSIVINISDNSLPKRIPDVFLGLQRGTYTFQGYLKGVEVIEPA